MDDGQYIAKLQGSYLDQVSLSSQIVWKVLQNCSVETSFGK